MTKIAAGADLLKRGVFRLDSELIWWSVTNISIAAPNEVIYTSDMVPDGAIVREVQIQACPDGDYLLTNLRIHLRIVQTMEPTLAQMLQAEKIIPWKLGDDDFHWRSVGRFINESWPCYKTLRGSNMRFAVSFDATTADAVRARVGVGYSV